MSGDVVERAKAAVDKVPTGAATLRDFDRYIIRARTAVSELADALESSKESCEQWKSLWRENTAQAAAAIEERDRANTEVEKLRGAIETIRYTAKTAAMGAHAIGNASKERLCLDILAVIERNEKP